MLLLLAIGCASQCEQACTLMYHAGERDCDPSAANEEIDVSYGDDGLTDFERVCVDLCAATVEANDRDLDEARDEWAECVLDEKQDIRKGIAKYGEPDDEVCAAMMGECGTSPCRRAADGSVACESP